MRSLVLLAIVAVVLLSAGCTSGPSMNTSHASPAVPLAITPKEPTPLPTTLSSPSEGRDLPPTESTNKGCRNDTDCRLEQPDRGCCDGTCYDTSDRICCGGSVQVSYYFTSKGRFQYICCHGVLYEESYGCCNEAPYLLGKEACCNGTVYNPSRQFCCAGKIFEGTAFSCCNDTIVTGKNRCCGDFICPELLQCCPTKDGPQCYDPAYYRCGLYPSKIY